jgi:hypothetical protein
MNAEAADWRFIVTTLLIHWEWNLWAWCSQRQVHAMKEAQSNPPAQKIEHPHPFTQEDSQAILRRAVTPPLPTPASKAK